MTVTLLSPDISAGNLRRDYRRDTRVFDALSENGTADEPSDASNDDLHVGEVLGCDFLHCTFETEVRIELRRRAIVALEADELVQVQSQEDMSRTMKLFPPGWLPPRVLVI